TPINLAAVEQLVAATDAVVSEALAVAQRRTDGGKDIDDAQVHCERLAYAATEVAATKALLAYARAAAEHGQTDAAANGMAAVFAGEVAQRLASQADAHAEDFGLDEAVISRTFGSAAVKALVRSAVSDARVRAIGRQVIQQRGANHAWVESDIALMTRDSV